MMEVATRDLLVWMGSAVAIVIQLVFRKPAAITIVASITPAVARIAKRAAPLALPFRKGANRAFLIATP
jgi:hypothetical protein